jgi:Dolichyl-phosphate-mannose-protein mannosyltransferase
MSPSPLRTALVLIVFAALFLTLSVASFTRTAATWDEPQHLTTGYLALKYGDYRLDPEHPPFLRIWAALPLLARDDIRTDIQVIDKVDPLAWADFLQFQYAHLFLYKANDADRLLYPARFMIALLGVLLGVLLFFWALEWLGFWPAVVGLGCYAIEPNILAHSSLVTTDFGITCFFFGSAYFLWRTTRRLSMGNLCGLVALTALAAVSKFSAVVLGPSVVALLTVHSLRAIPWACRIGPVQEIPTRLGKTAASAAIVLLVALVCWGTIWAAYGFRYLPSDTPGWHYDFEDNEILRARTPAIANAVHWIDAHHLLPNAFSEGFLIGQTKAQGRGTYLAGEFSTQGWWYFFPVAFLIKTPVSLVVLFIGGLLTCLARRKGFLQDNLFVLLPMGVYLAAALSSKLNIGLRHILPIYPFVILLAALCAREFINTQRKSVLAALGLLCAFWLFEFARVYPHNLAFFNQFVGGPQHGYEYLADSNLDWGQDLKPLKKWMDQQGIQQINLAYFGTADPAYYGMHCTYLPGSPFFAESQISLPRLPGYVAVSDTVLVGVYLSPAGRAFYNPLLEKRPAADIGYSIRVYWVDSRWW